MAQGAPWRRHPPDARARPRHRRARPRGPQVRRELRRRHRGTDARRIRWAAVVCRARAEGDIRAGELAPRGGEPRRESDERPRARAVACRSTDHGGGAADRRRSARAAHDAHSPWPAPTPRPGRRRSRRRTPAMAACWRPWSRWPRPPPLPPCAPPPRPVPTSPPLRPWRRDRRATRDGICARYAWTSCRAHARRGVRHARARQRGSVTGEARAAGGGGRAQRQKLGGDPRADARGGGGRGPRRGRRRARGQASAPPRARPPPSRAPPSP